MKTESDKQGIAYEEDVEWLNEKTTVTMRNELWCALRMYIDIQKLARMADLEQWRNFAREVDEYGKPKYINAEVTVEFMERQEKLLEEIMTYTDKEIREQAPERSKDEAKVLEV